MNETPLFDDVVYMLSIATHNATPTYIAIGLSTTKRARMDMYRYNDVLYGFEMMKRQNFVWNRGLPVERPKKQ